MPIVSTMPITTLVFDLDDTLYDHRPVEFSLAFPRCEERCCKHAPSLKSLPSVSVLAIVPARAPMCELLHSYEPVFCLAIPRSTGMSALHWPNLFAFMAEKLGYDSNAAAITASEEYYASLPEGSCHSDLHSLQQLQASGKLPNGTGFRPEAPWNVDVKI